MNKDKILNLMNETTADVDFAVQISNTVVEEKTSELDYLMREIQTEIVNAPEVIDSVVERYLLQLTNAVYFITTRCETFGFYDDITKANARLKYNELYAKNQLDAATSGKKVTNADNQLYAETNSIDENVLNIIYARSVKIIKGKLESANEMIRTLSKLLSVHMNVNTATSTSRRLLEG